MYFLFLVITLSKSKDLDSAELARKIKKGDQDAFKVFYNEHHEPLLRFLLSKGVDKSTAADLIQKAFIYIWEHRKNIDPNKSLRAYLFKIGYTRMLNHFRDQSKFGTSEAVPEAESQITPEDYTQTQELRKAIDKAIKAMPEKRSMVFEMCFIQEFTYREAAEALDLSKKTIENHMGLALKDIRASLSEFIPDK